jgi:penicillin-binding protein 1A
MLKIIKILFYLAISSCIAAILFILISYLLLKPNLPQISLVDETSLQMPLKIYTKDEILIGEYGEIKRRPLEFDSIPLNIRNAFLAAEDDAFFEHQGISYSGLLRSVKRCLGPQGCVGGGGTITMQVVRGYLLTRDQTLIRKAKEIFLALELESTISKEEIFELYINRNFFGNRSYGIEAAANTYFNKSTLDLNLAESAAIAAMAQSPSRVNAIRSPVKTKQRRNWILYRMHKLEYINDEDYEEAISIPLKVAKNINLYDVDGRYLAELARQQIIQRYGLQAYKNGWSVYTTLDSRLQESAHKNLNTQLTNYHKRHGWIESPNFLNIFNLEELEQLKNLNSEFISLEIGLNSSFENNDLLANKINSIFDNHPYYETHAKGIIVNMLDDTLYFLNERFEIKNIPWSSEYLWARNRLTINEKGPAPKSFEDFLNIGDLIYLKKENEFLFLDQIPEAEASLISLNPNTGSVEAYIGGLNFSKSNFDRVRLSYPQSGSSFKPFLYASGLANGYNLSSLINDAPIVFEDKNLESVWRPQNYTGKFYGPTSLREALIQSINIVSIKLLREIGINKSHDFLGQFGFEKSRLPSDLSLALGSGNFSPAEMVRAFGVIANGGFLIDPWYVERIEDRDGSIIYSHDDYIISASNENLSAFPWLNTMEMNVKKPYFLIKPEFRKERVVDERIAYLIHNNLQELITRGSAGRRSSVLNRKDIAGKTGTTNDAISTWFSGFHEDLVTTVWVGTDDFSSLGDNEFGSTIALPIWVDYMDNALENLDVKSKPIPEGISFVRVNKNTGQIDNLENKDSYFELFLDENIKD